jgi:predicted DNA-binding transcriptional regulator YafY
METPYTMSVLGRNLIKVLKAVNLFSRPGGATIADLESELETSRRSVYRLFDTLQDLNFPIYEEYVDGRTKSWHLEEGFLTKLPNLDFPDLKLTKEELLVLYLAISRGNILGKTEFNRYLGSLQKKLHAFLPTGAQPDTFYKKLDDVFIPVYQGTKNYRGREEMIEDLITGAAEHRTCTGVYHSFSSDSVHPITFNPLKLFEWNSGMYLFATLLPDNEIRTIAVDRLTDLTLSDDTFTYPEDFDAEAKLDEAFTVTCDDPVDVQVWFSNREAPYIRERQWATEQSIEENDDGSIILSMHTSGAGDVKRWVMSYGKEARLLEPEYLVKEIQDDITALSQIYFQ